MTPIRIQRRRTKGWRAPLDSQGRRPLHVGRGTRWGNPHTQVRYPALDGSEWEHEGRRGKTSGERHSIRALGYVAHARQHSTATHQLVPELTLFVLKHRPNRSDGTDRAGQKVQSTGQPCHADVLLDVANRAAP
ncbi:hypothetical protein QIS99_30345 [Streptomyces sp. B-S-A8]|uniref:Uncharacterized protein n=1 Tax=Streptomyces solicavernae TaxID=3043614 RepID=A0ABT6S3H8_9ACTN|nr:hypothetical protein [Streptomyces sp. B-S-A8]MDI3390461.1 hypothetical protein [Streptomyces sp. B-S-A8]